MIFPYHPAYGLPDEWRTEAVMLSIKYGIKKASKQMNVSPQSIIRWRKSIGLR